MLFTREHTRTTLNSLSSVAVSEIGQKGKIFPRQVVVLNNESLNYEKNVTGESTSMQIYAAFIKKNGWKGFRRLKVRAMHFC